jgi:hypothetical protein
MLVRSLRLRGRLWHRELLVGVPGDDLGPSVHHVAWQASHEATVLEVSRRARDLGVDLAERSVERIALVLLAERAAKARRSVEHARWLAHFGEPLPITSADRLEPMARELLLSLR